MKQIALGDGRTATFIKDLSELTPEKSDEALALLEESVLGVEDGKFLVIAANHGQILERLRDLGAWFKTGCFWVTQAQGILPQKLA